MVTALMCYVRVDEIDARSLLTLARPVPPFPTPVPHTFPSSGLRCNSLIHHGAAAEGPGVLLRAAKALPGNSRPGLLVPRSSTTNSRKHTPPPVQRNSAAQLLLESVVCGGCLHGHRGGGVQTEQKACCGVLGTSQRTEGLEWGISRAWETRHTHSLWHVESPALAGLRQRDPVRDRCQ